MSHLWEIEKGGEKEKKRKKTHTHKKKTKQIWEGGNKEIGKEERKEGGKKE